MRIRKARQVTVTNKARQECRKHRISPESEPLGHEECQAVEDRNPINHQDDLRDADARFELDSRICVSSGVLEGFFRDLMIEWAFPGRFSPSIPESRFAYRK
jgi:hypothetical protein